MPRWSDWFGGRASDARAVAYVAALREEPPSQDVEWLATHGTNGDTDHARWELRYLRRAVGLLVAQHDALDDRTASLVASELSHALAHDPHVDAGKRRIAEQQFNARLHAYSEALRRREAGQGAATHGGRTLLEFAGRRDALPSDVVEQASELVARYRADANRVLRAHFGVADLPDDVAPSALRPGQR